MTPASMPLNIEFDAIIAREKNSGWSCAILPGSGIAFGTRKPVKVAGTVDDVAFDATMLPIGDGTHMVPLKAALRKQSVNKRATPSPFACTSGTANRGQTIERDHLFAHEAGRALSLRQLASQRHHIFIQLDDLTDAQLRSAVLPSGWTPLGLVRHLTLSDER